MRFPQASNDPHRASVLKALSEFPLRSFFQSSQFLSSCYLLFLISITDCIFKKMFLLVSCPKSLGVGWTQEGGREEGRNRGKEYNFLSWTDNRTQIWKNKSYNFCCSLANEQENNCIVSITHALNETSIWNEITPFSGSEYRETHSTYTLLNYNS